MARIPRSLKIFPRHAIHKVWRGHNREPNLQSDYEKLSYLEFLNDDLENKKFEAGASIQALTLMSTHTHEIFMLENPQHFSGHMRRHHSRYGAFFNKLKNRCGKVAQDRPHTTLIADYRHEIRATCYVHANPLRANMVKDASHYRWSTHRLYAFGKRESWMRNIKFPEWYQRLGRTAALRQRAYRKIFAQYLKKEGMGPKRFLKALFFGPLPWINHRKLVIAAWRKSHTPPLPSG